MDLYRQLYDPLENIFLSGALASLPIVLFLISLVVLKLKGYLAAFLTVLLSFGISIFAYKMPVGMALMSLVEGFLTGLWPIGWIIITAMFLYKLSVKSGYFELLKQSVMAITPDHRIQVILISFCFGGFLEGSIGFGAPIAISAALLVGLGLNPLKAAGLSLIANTSSGTFGGVGIPIIALGSALNIDSQTIAIMVSKLLFPIAFISPFFIIFLIDGFRGLRQTFWPVFVAAISFAGIQYASAFLIGAQLPDILAGLSSLILSTVFLKFYKIKKENIYRFDDLKDFDNLNKLKSTDVIKAWLPFVFLVLTIMIWSLPFVGNILSSFSVSFVLPLLNEGIVQVAPIVSEDKVLKSIFKFDIIQATGTSILLAAAITIFVLKIKFDVVKSAAKETIGEMQLSILTIGLVVAYAFIAKYSGQAATMGLALANTGNYFAFFSPIIGWLGVFLTGSVTSSNLLFGGLQQVTAIQVNVPDLVFLTANVVGGAVGKLISPQSVAIACAAVGLAGKESQVFNFTMKWSILFIIMVGLLIWLVTNFLTNAFINNIIF